MTKEDIAAVAEGPETPDILARLEGLLETMAAEHKQYGAKFPFEMRMASIPVYYAQDLITHIRALATQRVKRDGEVAELRDENSKLAAGVCIYPNGEGLLGDEHGNSFCSVEQERKRLDERETELMAQLNAAEALLAEAREALTNYACHGGDKVPCLRTAEQCRTDCGKPAGDAIVKIDATLRENVNG